MEWMLARDWFHSASTLGSADARSVPKALSVTCMDPSLGREASRAGVRLMTMHQAGAGVPGGVRGRRLRRGSP